MYTQQEIENMKRAAGHPSTQLGYPGGDPRLSYAQPEMSYDGSGDDVLDFGGHDGAQSFQLKGHKNRQFTMIIANANAAVRTARIYGGYNQLTPTLSVGLVATGAFNDVDGNAGLSGASGNANKTIEEFLNFLLFNPTRIPAIKIKSTVASQIESVLSVDTLTPFSATTQSLEIYPDNEQNEYTFQDKVAVLATDFQLSNQENAVLPIQPLSTATVTWFAGASYNTASALQTKARKAQRNIAARG